VHVGVLKSKIRFWSLPQSLLIPALLLLIDIAINILYNRYTSNKCLIEECDSEEHVEVTGTATASCLKGRP
jgi:hypothetical protein